MRNFKLVAIAAAAASVSILADPAAAAGRVALVIGNAAYEHTVPLRNPGNDASDVARALDELDFEVIHGQDLDKDGFSDMLREFARTAQGADVSLFFYAGHGLQVDGKNYLVPVDAKLVEEVDLQIEAFELDDFMHQMRGSTNLVFLDACRDNPLVRDLARSMGASRSTAIGRGLSRVESGSGTLIAYATQPGNTANDGGGRNSPFTGALLAHIETPGLSVNDLLTTMTDMVITSTHGSQQPWTHSSLRKPFYFKPAASPRVSPSAVALQTESKRMVPEGGPVREFSDCPHCPRMVAVPAGIYEMGSPSGKGAHDERHRHRVTIAEPIAIGMFEVTRGEYRQFAEETNRLSGSACWQYDGVKVKEGSGPADPGFIQGENEPMACVSWMDARAYVDWLSLTTGKRYRLLSESEWEHAARGGTGTDRYWDESESAQCQHANGADVALRRRYTDWHVPTTSCDDGNAHTSEAGRYGPNNFGLYDMLGNVREWVEDCWHPSYDGAPADGSAWTGGGNCSLRVLRGGSWLDGPGGVRSATRDKGTIGTRFSANGFRVARALD